MTADTTRDTSASSSATLGRPSASPYPFSDATVVQTPRSTVQPILIKVLPTHIREDGRFEITDATGVTRAIRSRFEQVLDRINVLLAEPATPEAEIVNSHVAFRALGFAGGPIAELDTPTEVFPLADGGLLFRWRTERGAVETEFDADGDIIVMIEDAHGERRAGHAHELWATAARFLRGL
jgi:hypothetical protein